MTWTSGGRVYDQTIPLPPRHGEALREATYYVVVRHNGTAWVAPLTHDEVVTGAAQRMARDGGPAYWVGIKNETAGVLRNPTA